MPAYVAAAAGLPSPLPVQAAALPAEALSLHESAQAEVLPKVGKQFALTASAFALLQKPTKSFDMLVDCIVHASKLPSQSVTEFLGTSSHKGHALINASTCTAHEARSLILHVQQRRKLQEFSAVYLLPACKDASWKTLLRDVAHIARVKVSANLHLHAYHQRVFIPDLTVWPCTLAGEGARALHDGGSQLNLVSQRWATKNGLATPAGDALSITLGNGQQTPCSGQLTLKLQLQSFKDAIPCHIMKRPEQYDVILGDAFIRQTCAVTESDCQGLKCMNLNKGNKRIKVTRPESAKASEVTAPLLSAMQVAKAVRKKQDCFLIRVMPKDADVAQPAAAPAVLKTSLI